jgi:predicted RNA methylase
MKTGRVFRRKRDVNGDLIGKFNSNPYMDKRRYIVSFEDVVESEYAANVIAENMLSRCDLERNQYAVMSHIIDHKSDSTAVPREEGFAWSRGRKSPR